MSLVIAIKEKNKIYVGCDTRTDSHGHYIDGHNVKFQKALLVDKKEGLIVGSTGTSAATNLAASVMKKLDYSVFDIDFIVDYFWPSFVRKATDNAMLEQDGGIGCNILLVKKDKGFLIDSCGGIIEVIDYVCMGSGGELAESVIFTLDKIKKYDPQTKITMAIEAAAHIRGDISSEAYIGCSDGTDFKRFRVKD